MTITIITNHVPRDVIDAYELSAEERAEFDYLNWPAIENGEDSASFFRYKGMLYDLGEFEFARGMGYSEAFAEWDGIQTDSFFSGILVKYGPNCESVIVGRYFS